MKITRSMLVPDSAEDSDADVKFCRDCQEMKFHVPQWVMVFSSSGARRIRLWACEDHPLPKNVTDLSSEG